MTEKLEIKVNKENFKREVLEAELPVLVDFWAEWCGPCRMIAPTIGEIAAEYEGRLKVCKLNVDEAPQVASDYGIMNIPTIILFKNGEVAEKFVGTLPKGVIIQKIDTLI